MKMQQEFGKEDWGFHPITFILPADWETLTSLCTNEPLEKWIAKPVLGGQVKIKD